ncbi:MAG: peptidase S41 [Planctomycetes bacterium]|nr:peptidase S41 [Planctomycetota bacterium]
MHIPMFGRRSLPRFTSCGSPATVVPALGFAVILVGSTVVPSSAIESEQPNVTAEVSGQHEPHGGMLRFPDVSDSHIVFMYANDLWLVPRSGGMAQPLASPAGQEQFPKFSPDGDSIAFMGNYDGNRDLYTIPVGGGVPYRVTHHPAGERLSDWTSDDQLLFSAGGLSGLSRVQQLLTVSADGGLPQALPIPYGAVGSISEDRAWLAYTPASRDFRTWKRYQGGLATDIWVFNLKTLKSKKITDWPGTDTSPMWHGSTVYYVSDQGPSHKLNIWSYDTKTNRRRQVTKYDDWDVKFPSMGPGENGEGEIVFQHGASIKLLNLKTNKPRTVKITVPGDHTAIRPQRFDAAEHIQSWEISSTGKRAAVSARGDIWTLPAKEGAPRNLTRTSGVAERDPGWSPDGRWIAYLSDATGEYELYITQSDGKGETKQLTSDGSEYLYSPFWSPDSAMILYYAKSGTLYLHTIETGETVTVDHDPWAEGPSVSWSHDSKWIALSHRTETASNGSLWLYSVDSGEVTQVTTGMFNDRGAVFDRKGDYLYYVSDQTFSPTYSSLDTTYIYEDTGNLLAVPLRDDIGQPWPPKSDEEAWEEESDDDSGKADDADQDDGGSADDNGDAPGPDDGVSGTWKGQAHIPEAGPLPFTLTLELAENNSVTGRLEAGMYSGSLSGEYSPSDGHLSLTLTLSDGMTVAMDLVITDGSLEGTASADGEPVQITAERSSAGDSDDDADKDTSDDDEADEDADEAIEIDLDGFESRAFRLPVGNGSFGALAVNDKNQLIYAQRGQGLKLFDLSDDDPSPKTIADGVMGYTISADGKKLLTIAGRSGASIRNASPGGSADRVGTDGMEVTIDPRAEWKQVFTDAWRIQRDFFYDPGMHGVDWQGVYEQYLGMIDDCATRDDVSYVIGEMIGELNVGHAYYFGGGGEDQPSRNVGMLGCDFDLVNGAYRITRIYEGGPWDTDARGPLSANGVNVKEGDYLLAVNGIPMDTTKDPWAAFIGLAGTVVELTVSDEPVLRSAEELKELAEAEAEADDDADSDDDEGDDEDEEEDEMSGQRDVLITPTWSEGTMRYRAWIERNRKYVEEQTDGKVGYIYVPNTGVNGQNDLYRQFFGQIDKQALIIDERWNGGGQIPTRFIELLNRPITNYWARRDGKDWPWPPDSHQGPKCMLINGWAGSGGDAFPHYFRQAGLGKLIGMRTWGGLVGISGNPSLIDGGYTAVPTFGFYDPDGTWGIEGHGVDPDIPVLDDPALMQNGRDPQLDAAIKQMLSEIKTGGYKAPKRPHGPDRSGVGILEKDK